jgi:hypothetical protein
LDIANPTWKKTPIPGDQGVVCQESKLDYAAHPGHLDDSDLVILISEKLDNTSRYGQANGGRVS